MRFAHHYVPQHIVITLSNLLGKHNQKEENGNPLASNEYCHHIGDKYQLLREEKDIDHPGYSHHYNQRCATLDPVPAGRTFLLRQF